MDHNAMSRARREIDRTEVDVAAAPGPLTNLFNLILLSGCAAVALVLLFAMLQL